MPEKAHTLIKFVAGYKNIVSRASGKNRPISKALDRGYQRPGQPSSARHRSLEPQNLTNATSSAFLTGLSGDRQSGPMRFTQPLTLPLTQVAFGLPSTSLKRERNYG